MKPLYDVIAKIPAREFPDEWVIRGNHHDAWVNGAEDPISGLNAVLEEARVSRRTRQSRVEAEAHDRLLRVGRRRARPARLRRVARNARRRTPPESGRLRELRHERPRLPWCRRRALARKIRQRCCARHYRSRDQTLRLEALAAQQLTDASSDEARAELRSRSDLRIDISRRRLRSCRILRISLASRC